MRLIDADKLLKALNDEKIETNEIIGKTRKLERMLCIQYINTEPTVELCKDCEDRKQAQYIRSQSSWYELQALRKFKKEHERPQGEWIPVDERLPDKNMPCLVSVGKFNFIQIAMYSDLMETIDHKIFYQGDYGKNNFQNITEYVNAWQPLPEPYKKGGAEIVGGES